MMAETAADSSSMLDQALAYLGQGRSVFPVCTPIPGTARCLHHQNCTSPGKVALVKWKPYQDQRPAEADVRSWWGRNPTANIAMATGPVSGVDVVDLDGELATREAFKRGLGDIGPVAFTGRIGGRHVWYAHRDDAPTVFAQTSGIDFRGYGGYVLLPPSLHHSGARYKWSSPPDGEPLPELPRWIDELATQGKSNGHVLNGTSALDVSTLLLEGVAEGSRDDTLFRLAAKLRGMGMPYDIALDVVERSADRCSPPFPLDQARAKVDSAYRRYEPNPEGSKPIRLGGRHQAVDPETGEVLDAWQWTVYDIDDFMAREIPPVEWLVEGFIRDQAIVGNFGGPGTLKTYFMTQLAISMAAGERFLERFATRQARVLIVQEDTLEADYQQAYLRPMLKAMAFKPGDLHGWLFVAPSNDLLLDDPQRLLALENWIAEYRPALVCMDAFYLLHSGEGMTAKDLQPVLFTLKRLRKAYGCAFWLLDHNRKTSGGPTNDEAAIDRWYGGRSKSAASDAVVETRARRDDDSASSFHVLKLRGSKRPEPVNVRLVDGKLVVDDNQSDQAAEGTKNLIVDWLMTQGSGRTVRDIAMVKKLTPRHVQRAIKDLAKEGRVVNAGKSGKAELWTVAGQGDDSEAPENDPETLPWA